MISSPLWTVTADGMATALLTREAETEALAAGLRVYGSPAGCALYEGVQATVFDKPLRAEPFWNGSDVMANGLSIAGLAPAGTRLVAKPLNTSQAA